MLANIFELDALLVGGLVGALAVTILKPVVKNLIAKLMNVTK